MKRPPTHPPTSIYLYKPTPTHPHSSPITTQQPPPSSPYTTQQIQTNSVGTLVYQEKPDAGRVTKVQDGFISFTSIALIVVGFLYAAMVCIGVMCVRVYVSVCMFFGGGGCVHA